MKLIGLARGIDFEDGFEQKQRANDARDTRGIGNGVGKRGKSGAIGREVWKHRQRLLRGGGGEGALASVPVGDSGRPVWSSGTGLDILALTILVER